MLAADTVVSRPPLPPGPYVVAGAGRAGRAAAVLLAARVGAAQVAVWDAGGLRLDPRARPELARAGIALAVGGDPSVLLGEAGCLVKSPGFAAGAPIVRAAAARGLPILDEAEAAWRLDRRPLVAVTGTNGKSTVTTLVTAIMAAAGRRPVMAGNLETGPALSEAAGGPGDLVVAELSSYQLEGAPRLLPDAAAFTGFSLSHLARHRTLEEYAALKRLLFLRGERAVPVAAIGGEGDVPSALAADLVHQGSRVARVARAGDYRLTGERVSWAGSRASLVAPGGAVALETRGIGRHNLENAAVAFALADLLGVARDVALAAIAVAAPVPGRFERVDDGRDVAVVVDYAHNPDGIARVAQAARDLAPGPARLHLLICAPAFYDDSQQRAMGRAAVAGADRLVVTTDRWTVTEPAEPPAALLAGAGHGAEVVPERATAIAAAIAGADPGDVVLILGRGRRTNLVDTAGNAVGLSDAEMARAVLAGPPAP